MPNKPDLTVQVAIVGAGPSGLVLALLLKKYGVDTVVLERHDSTYDEPRAVGISGESLRICQQIGVLETLEPELRMDVGHRYYGTKGQLLTQIFPRQTPDGYPAKSVFDQPQLEQTLAAQAQKVKVDLRFQHEVTEISQNENGVELTVNTPEGVKHVHAEWLVGCDGGRSTVRKSQGIKLQGSTQKERWVCYDVIDDPHNENFADLHCNGKRPVVVAPGAHKRCRYEVMLHENENDEDFIKFEKIKELLAPFRSIKEDQVRRARVYVAQQRVATKLSSGRVFLSGDAYHLMPPFAGQGLNSGFRDSANLAWKLAAVVKGEASRKLLETYEIERKPHVEEMVKTSVRIGKVVMVVKPGLARLRDLALNLLKIVPPLREYITQMRFMKPPQLSHGAVVHTATSKQEAYAGLFGAPVPRYKLAAGKTDLDGHLGDGWALIELAGKSHADNDHKIEPLKKLLNPAELKLGEGGLAVLEAPAYISEPKEKVWLLIRPDRFVAAIFNSEEALQVARELETWFDAGVRTP